MVAAGYALSCSEGTSNGHGASTAAMAAAPSESARGSEGEWERSSASALVLHYVEQGTGARGSRASNGGARTAAWQPRRRSVEQVAGAGVGEVYVQVGPALGRFSPWD